MAIGRFHSGLLFISILGVVQFLLMAGCSAPGQSTPGTRAVSPDSDAGGDNPGTLIMPPIDAAELDGQPLRVVATTSIIGDVVAHVGGNAIALTTLMDPGQDPHGYEPVAQDLAAAAKADVVFVNGWDLEEALVHELKSIVQNAPLVPVAAHIEPLALGGRKRDDRPDQSHYNADPHTWFSVQNVKVWVENVRFVLTTLNPANAATYERNARSYLIELEELRAYAEQELARIPPDKRFLVTNHDAFGYFAHEFGFDILGTVIPGVSVLAEPSARDLAVLIEAMKGRGVCTIFTEDTLNENLAEAVGAELHECQQVRIISLYTGAIGTEGSGDDSYIDMFRANIDRIVEGLK